MCLFCFQCIILDPEAFHTGMILPCLSNSMPTHSTCCEFLCLCCSLQQCCMITACTSNICSTIKTLLPCIFVAPQPDYVCLAINTQHFDQLFHGAFYWCYKCFLLFFLHSGVLRYLSEGNEIMGTNGSISMIPLVLFCGLFDFYEPVPF